jgi:hypothetical protein
MCQDKLVKRNQNEQVLCIFQFYEFFEWMWQVWKIYRCGLIETGKGRGIRLKILKKLFNYDQNTIPFVILMIG